MLKAECCNHKAQLSPEFEPGQALAGSYPNESTPSWLFFGQKRVPDKNASRLVTVLIFWYLSLLIVNSLAIALVQIVLQTNNI